MTRRPILYVNVQTTIGEGWIRRLIGKPLMLGTMKVGEVVDIKDSEPDRMGIVIQWSDEIEVATML